MSILAIDFGGTRTRAGWYSEGLQLLARDETLSQVDEPPDAVIERIINLARRVVPRSDSPRAIGICAPGPQAFTGLILHAATLPGWHNVPLAQRIGEAFDAPVYMENDANLGALAEYHFGAAKGADPALYLTVSTGIGGGAILNGELFTGWRGLAMEPGHFKFMKPDGRLYSLEDLASGTAIGRAARERLANSDEPSSLREVERVDGRQVGAAAAAGDALAKAIIEEAGHWLGIGLLNLTHLFNPQVIVIGGSVSELGDLILTPARGVLAEYLIDPLYNYDGLIRPAKLHDDVCLLGAALHARQME